MTSTAPTLTEDQSQNLPPSAAPPPPVLQDVPTARLMPHPRNPRRDLGDLTDLTASIRQQGVLEPLVVVPKGRASFLVIAGHRRAAAAKLAKVKTVPCVVREDLIDDRQQVAAMLVENLHRADLTPVEEAAAYEQLLLDDALTVDALAAVVGQPVKRVQSRLKLRKLSPGMQDQIHAGQLTIEQGLAIGEFTDDPKAAARLAKAAGTPNWGWELARARGDRKDARAIDRRIAKMLKSGQITLTHEDVDEQAQALADERAEAAAQRDAADAATAAAVGAATLARRDFLRQRIRSTTQPQVARGYLVQLILTRSSSDWFGVVSDLVGVESSASDVDDVRQTLRGWKLEHLAALALVAGNLPGEGELA